ncbi:MAG: hypothetical protein IJ515_06770 [Clostridia bacterium]|nr:hypothetical protein [Clostridia bacterium]
MTNSKKKTTVRTEVRELDGIEYRYELTSSRATDVASYGLPLYSVSVSMHFRDTGRVSEGRTENIFSDVNKAGRFFDKIVDNLATPIDLPYIVEDELA